MFVTSVAGAVHSSGRASHSGHLRVGAGASRVVGKGVEDPIAKPKLLFDRERRVPEDPLIQFAGSTSPTASMREREVVEDEELART